MTDTREPPSEEELREAREVIQRSNRAGGPFYALQEEIALALRAARQRGREEWQWQSIKTVPRERDVFLYCELWEDTFGEVQIGQLDHGGEWNFQSEMSLEDCGKEYEPTHWRPLPSPPRSDEAEGRK